MLKGPDRGRSRRDAGMAPLPADGDLIAIQALTFIGQNAQQARRFFDISGLDASNLRQSASDPGFLLGVLDYLVGDEPLLLSFAESIGRDPAMIVRAYDVLRRAARKE
jgi:hypothetical protein